MQQKEKHTVGQTKPDALSSKWLQANAILKKVIRATFVKTSSILLLTAGGFAAAYATLYGNVFSPLDPIKEIIAEVGTLLVLGMFLKQMGATISGFHSHYCKKKATTLNNICTGKAPDNSDFAQNAKSIIEKTSRRVSQKLLFGSITGISILGIAAGLHSAYEAQELHKESVELLTVSGGVLVVAGGAFMWSLKHSAKESRKFKT